MVRRLFLLFACITSLFASQPWELGITGGGTLLGGLLGDYWKSSPSVGVELLYPFHKRVPVLLSGHVSFHHNAPNPPEREGFHPTEKDLLFIHYALLWQWLLLEERPLTPYLGVGLSHSTFYMSTTWPAPDYSDESEFGAVVAAGAQYALNRRVRFFADYRFNLISSAPHALYFSTLRTGLRFTLERRGRDE